MASLPHHVATRGPPAVRQLAARGPTAGMHFPAVPFASLAYNAHPSLHFHFSIDLCLAIPPAVSAYYPAALTTRRGLGRHVCFGCRVLLQCLWAPLNMTRMGSARACGAKAGVCRQSAAPRRRAPTARRASRRGLGRHVCFGCRVLLQCLWAPLNMTRMGSARACGAKAGVCRRSAAPRRRAPTARRASRRVGRRLHSASGPACSAAPAQAPGDKRATCHLAPRGPARGRDRWRAYPTTWQPAARQLSASWRHAAQQLACTFQLSPLLPLHITHIHPCISTSRSTFAEPSRPL